MTDIRMHLTDRDVARLPSAKEGWYLARDTELRGFFVVIGKRTKTFTVQADLRISGSRKTVRLAIGDAGETTTREARAIGKGYLAQIAKGEHPRPPLEQKACAADVAVGTTLRSAWLRYREGHLERKGRSAKTIEGYRDHIERIFGAWLDRSLTEFGNDPGLLAREHDRISGSHGPYMANGAMRTFRAVYNHARRADRRLPAENPVMAVDWNPERRRDSALGLADLPRWFAEVGALTNPVRREFHLLTLLSGCRPEALKQARVCDLDFRRRILHIRHPKGGEAKAFDIPLSRPMMRSFIRVRRLGMRITPRPAEYWIFPADSASGHISEQREDRDVLFKWGNDLRQSFRTLAQAAGVSELDARLLMNHAVTGVNEGYITRHKLLENHLRRQQEAISDTIMAAARKDSTLKPIGSWLVLAK